MLEPTSEFHAMARRLCQDVDAFGRTEEEFYAWIFGDVTSSNASNLAAFLDKVLDPSRSSADVAAVWNATSNDVLFKRASDIKAFLKEARRQLTSKFGV